MAEMRTHHAKAEAGATHATVEAAPRRKMGKGGDEPLTGWKYAGDVALDSLTLAGLVLVCVLGGVLLERARWFAALARSSALRLPGLPPAASAAFLAAWASPRTAGALLAGAYKGGALNAWQTWRASLANSVASLVNHAGKSTFPTAVALLGPVGWGYVGWQFLTSVCCTELAFLLGRFGRRLPPPPFAAPAPADPEATAATTVAPVPPPPWWRETWRRAWPILLRILLITVPLVLLLDWLEGAGHLAKVNAWLPDWLRALLPVEALAILASQLASAIAAIGIAAGLLSAGTITPADAFLALALGNLLSSPIRALRRSLPSAFGLYPPGLAVAIALGTQAVRIVLGILTLLYIFWALHA